jgi:hypothetical protein
VHPSQGFVGDEPLQRFQSQRELAEGMRALGGNAAGAEAGQMFRRRVLGAVDDAQVLAAAALQGRLDEAARRLAASYVRSGGQV